MVRQKRLKSLPAMIEVASEAANRIVIDHADAREIGGVTATKVVMSRDSATAETGMIDAVVEIPSKMKIKSKLRRQRRATQALKQTVAPALTATSNLSDPDDVVVDVVVSVAMIQQPTRLWKRPMRQ